MKSFCFGLLLLLFLDVAGVEACTVCFGDPNSKLTQSIGWGIWVMMFFLVMVLSLFVGLFLNFRRRMKRPQISK